MHAWNYGSELIHHTHLLNKGVKHHYILVLFMILDRSISFKVFEIPALDENAIISRIIL